MNNELYHYGVLGMKWGVRRDHSSSGGSRKKKTRSDDSKEASAIGKKKISQMTNTELKRVNERRRLEQEYSRLNPGSISRGLKFVATAAGIMGTALSVYNNGSQLFKLGREAGSKMMDIFGNSVVNDLIDRHL